ncbi:MULTISPECIES: hypothetical protein [unclassified Methylobacter]|uniref:hypothetical protein n=1 Tax=unclassified Methylobacter TaxID=2635283 RepID=UPI001894E1FA|nr:hypothetical protein [Methylobacter sp. BlB1]MBF6647465.1 hypothetical protein [Methylobacter sp. BlB1]
MDRENLQKKLDELLPMVESFRFDEQYDNEELYTKLNILEADIRAILKVLANPKPNPFMVV